MSRSLSALFAPRSIAVFGGSDRQESVGYHVLRNLVTGGYAGRLHVINPKRTHASGYPCLPDLASVGSPVDLAIIATPASTVQQIIRQCGECDVGAAIILSAGFLEAGDSGATMADSIVETARRFGVRLLGPNCLGLYSSAVSMNATFAGSKIAPGNLTLVSQSGALCTAILDWAEGVGLGFSNVVSLGEVVDIDFGEILDHVAMDSATSAILVYVEGIRDARRFMSGLRVAARLKPTVVLKAGKHAASERAVRSHTGALIGADDVFDAALRRAGAVRAKTIGQLFSAAQLLASGHRSQGNNLAIVTNAGGPGVMAADRAAEVGVELPALSKETLEALSASLPPYWSRQNPVDILGDATPERYSAALGVCLDDPTVDGVLAMLTPQAMTSPSDCARAVLDASTRDKPIVACWMGGPMVSEAKRLFQEHGLPCFNTPEASVDAFAFLWAHRQNQRLLMQVSSPMPFVARHDIGGARAIVESALRKEQHVLSSLQSKAILSAFGIRCSTQIKATNADDALLAAETLGFPVVLKVESPDITHKTDVGGVVLGLANGHAVRRAFATMVEEVEKRAPGARVEGCTIEHQHERTNGRELMVGVLQDPCFGPAISVGAGGTLVELLGDRSVGLPPLSTLAAREMIQRTRIAPFLGPWRGAPAVDARKLEEVLMRVSDLACELPELDELDINPLLVDDSGALALDARIVLRNPTQGLRPYAHMAVHPYPEGLTRLEQLPDGTDVVIRPIRPEDATSECAFIEALSPQTRFFRFMKSVKELTPDMLRRFTQIDYDREMAFVALIDVEGARQQVGVSRYVSDLADSRCEFALVVADAWQGKGIGKRLMIALLDVARQRGIKEMVGDILSANDKMLKLVTQLGFRLSSSPDDPLLRHATKLL